MFHLAGQIFFGLIVGTLAKLIVPGKDPGGVIVNAISGLAGSIMGTIIGHALFNAHRTAEWALSIAGAFVALGIYRIVEYYPIHLIRDRNDQ